MSTEKSMRILFVAPRLPLPADTGAKIRTFNLLKNAAVESKVTLLSFYFDDDDKAVEKIKNLGIEVHLVKAKEEIKPAKIFSHLPISIEKYRSEELMKKLQELLSNAQFDLVHFDHLHMGQYRGYVNGLPAVLDEHNVESIILKRCADNIKSFGKRMLFKSQAKKMARLEKEIVPKFTKCLTVSDTDKESLSRLLGQSSNIEVVPNGVDTEYFNSGFRDSPLRNTCNSSGGDSPCLVFTGSMDWLPNNDAVIYFCKEILPLILARNSKVKFYIVGKNPSKEVLKLAEQDKRIIVTGVVDDVRPYIAKSKVFVVPIRIGGGTRLKILEAMAMGKPVVSTTIGAEGIAYTHEKNIILRDSPEEFSKVVLMLLQDKAKRDTLGKAGRDLVCNNYDWNIIGKKLNKVYQEVTDATRKQR